MDVRQGATMSGITAIADKYNLLQSYSNKSQSEESVFSSGIDYEKEMKMAARDHEAAVIRRLAKRVQEAKINGGSLNVFLYTTAFGVDMTRATTFIDTSGVSVFNNANAQSKMVDLYV